MSAHWLRADILRKGKMSHQELMKGSEDISAIDQRDKWHLFWDMLGKNPFLAPPFWGLSLFYGFCVFLRKKAYSKGILSVKHLPYPVISIGNLTVGGTGKTPVVRMITEFLSDWGRNPVVLTRGYKRKGGKGLIVVQGNEKCPRSPEITGDEPYMLARWLPDVPILVSKDRYQAGIFAIKNLGADCFILDDGFQHLRLFRDTNILLVNARDPFGNGYLLPYGSLREPLGSLNRATLILLNKSTPNKDLRAVIDMIQRYNPWAPIIETSYKPESLVSASDGKKHVPIAKLKDKTVLAFSGIADPISFMDQLRNNGAKVRHFITFSDHHWFSEKEMERIRKMAHVSSVDYVVTTEKDGVRLPLRFRDDVHLLRMKMALIGSKNILEKILAPILVY